MEANQFSAKKNRIFILPTYTHTRARFREEKFSSLFELIVSK